MKKAQEAKMKKNKESSFDIKKYIKCLQKKAKVGMKKKLVKNFSLLPVRRMWSTLNKQTLTRHKGEPGFLEDIIGKLSTQLGCPEQYLCEQGKPNYCFHFIIQGDCAVNILDH